MPSPRIDPPQLNCQTVARVRGFWWVAQLKSLTEKRFAWDLIEAGIPHYLPQYRHRWRPAGGHWQYAMRLAVPGYCFFAGGYDEDRQPDLMTPYRVKQCSRSKVVQIIRTSLQGELREGLERLERLIASGGFDDGDCPVRDQLYRVIGGPLQGKEGPCIGVSDAGLTLLALPMFSGVTVPVEIPAGQLEVA